MNLTIVVCKLGGGIMTHRTVASVSSGVRSSRQWVVSSGRSNAFCRIGILHSAVWVVAVIVTPAIAVSADPHGDDRRQFEAMKCLYSGALEERPSFQGSTFTGVSHCLINRVANTILGHGFVVGQELLGKEARYFGRMGWDYEEGFRGELDTVVPLTTSPASAQGLRPPGRLSRALFLQTGVTTWRDDGTHRADARMGFIYRFGLSDDLKAGVVGAMTFLQEDLRTNHRRWVTGLDYLTRRLFGSFHYYLPMTDWRINRDGLEQRPLAGMKLDFRARLLPNIHARTSFSRWETSDGQRWDTVSSLAVAWHPSPWFRVFGRYGWKRDDGDEMVGGIAATVSFGGAKRRYGRLSGLVRLADDGKQTGPDALWRPVEALEPIRYAERSRGDENCADGDAGASLSFTQGAANTGDTIGLEAELPAPSCDGLTVTARLIPGAGSNPAAPGVDYDDRPIDITIVKGRRRGVAYFTLLNNAALAEERSLSAEIVSF